MGERWGEVGRGFGRRDREGGGGDVGGKNKEVGDGKEEMGEFGEGKGNMGSNSIRKIIGMKDLLGRRIRMGVVCLGVGGWGEEDAENWWENVKL